MRDLGRMRERYLRDAPPVRLGNLASNLLRLSQWVRMGRGDEAIVELMGEIAWLMEWTGESATAEPADMQREACRWRRVWPLGPPDPSGIPRPTDVHPGPGDVGPR